MLEGMAKVPIDVDVMLERIAGAVKPFRKAAMFELHEKGYTSVFQQLVACIISIRTLDEVSAPTAEKLFAVAATPQAVTGLTPAEIDKLIRACTFHEPKAKQIHLIAQRTVEEFGGELPCDFAVLTSFAGVGPKCANLALGVACGMGGIAVDIHVHRVTNRWGYVAAKTPEKTMVALEAKLPKKHWVWINALLVPFGKHICTGVRPKCSTCPVLEMCRQVAVGEHR